MAGNWDNGVGKSNVVLSALIVLLGTLKLNSRKSSVKLSTDYPGLPTLPSLPLIGPLHKLVLTTDPSKVFLSWYTKYGTSFRTTIFGQELVILNNPAWVKKLIGSSEPGHLRKYGFLYDIVFPKLSSGLSATSNIPEWKTHRNILAKAFTLGSLKEYLKLFNRHAKQLVIDLSDPSKSLHQMLHISTFRMISEISIGVDILTENDTKEIVEHYRKCQEMISYRGYHPWCISETVWNLHPKKKEMDYSLNKLMSRFAEIVKDARAQIEKSGQEEKTVKSVMDLLVAADAGISNEQIYVEIANTISAGHETTGVTLEYFMLNLALNPCIQEECRKEVDQMFETLEAETDGGNVTMDKLSTLEYMERCIKESMRLFTTIPFVMRQLGSPLKLEDDLVLQPGTAILVSGATIHRDATIYPEPSKYDPDRFLPENCQRRNLYAYLPFLQGPRNCIGWRMAMEEMKLLASYILRHFTLHTTNTQENVENILLKKMFPPPDLRVECRKRPL